MTAATAGPQWRVPDRVAVEHGVQVTELDEEGRTYGLLFQRYADPIDAHQGPLTRQQLAVLRLVAEGKSNPEVGRVLCISEETVKSHMMRLAKLIGARDRANAVAIGMRAGWLV